MNLNGIINRKRPKRRKHGVEDQRINTLAQITILPSRVGNTIKARSIILGTIDGFTKIINIR
eukprot:11707432-Karenia_brevis.AAC.1